MILEKIVLSKRKSLEGQKIVIPLENLKKQIENRQVRDFKEAIKRTNKLNIIAEVKKASPSKGIIRKNFNPVEIARAYEKNQVNAISVLTEQEFFHGKDEYLSLIRKETRVPILRKDFIIDPYQIYQSKVLGADAILLIAAILTGDQLRDFQEIAKSLNLGCLVEVHNLPELDRVLETGADIIGINNRNLKNFEVNIETTEKLAHNIPREKIIVSESGICDRKHMEYLENIGVDCVLVGESIMRAKSIGSKIKELRGG